MGIIQVIAIIGYYRNLVYVMEVTGDVNERHNELQDGTGSHRMGQELGELNLRRQNIRPREADGT